MLATVVITYTSGETHRVCGKGSEDAKDLEGCKVSATSSRWREVVGNSRAAKAGHSLGPAGRCLLHSSPAGGSPQPAGPLLLWFILQVHGGEGT